MYADEMQAEELKGLPNLVPVTYTDGPYHNFPDTQKICDGVWFVKAKGHTNGNSLVIAESDGLYYMFEADITYVDEALYENKLSVVYDDLPAARETLDRVREFVRNNPTVYCGTHTPQGYENLEAKRVIDLDNPVPTVLAEVDAVMCMTQQSTTVWPSKTCPMIGAVLAASNPRRSSIRHKHLI